MPAPPKPSPLTCSTSTCSQAGAFAGPSSMGMVNLNPKSQTKQESDISALRACGETNGKESHGSFPSPNQAASPAAATENKKRKVSMTLPWERRQDESDQELEASSNSLAHDDRRQEKNGIRSTSVTLDRLALEREKFLAEKEERLKESIRKDMELDLRKKASARDDLILDLKIIQTNPLDCPDETSKAALSLMKAAVLKKYHSNPSVT